MTTSIFSINRLLKTKNWVLWVALSTTLLLSTPAWSIPAPAPQLTEVAVSFMLSFSYADNEGLSRINNAINHLEEEIKKDHEGILRRMTLIVYAPDIKNDKELWKTMDTAAQKSKAILMKRGIAENMIQVLYIGSSFADKCRPKNKACIDNNKTIQLLVERSRLEYRRWPKETFALPPPRPAPMPLFSIPEIPVATYE